MNDRKLLELAAKAAGIDPNWDGLYWQWNPLTDDGDALRLAVKLDIVPRVINRVAFAWRSGVCDIQEQVGNDPQAAVRRAITRAAAEIGKGMP